MRPLKVHNTRFQTLISFCNTLKLVSNVQACVIVTWIIGGPQNDLQPLSFSCSSSSGIDSFPVLVAWYKANTYYAKTRLENEPLQIKTFQCRFNLYSVELWMKFAELSGGNPNTMTLCSFNSTYNLLPNHDEKLPSVPACFLGKKLPPHPLLQTGFYNRTLSEFLE